MMRFVGRLAGRRLTGESLALCFREKALSFADRLALQLC